MAEVEPHVRLGCLYKYFEVLIVAEVTYFFGRTRRLVRSSEYTVYSDSIPSFIST